MQSFRSVDDIDLFSGILAEKKVSGGLVGQLGAHILAAQFHRLKTCDRYFYENGNQLGSFSLGKSNALAYHRHGVEWYSNRVDWRFPSRCGSH